MAAAIVVVILVATSILVRECHGRESIAGSRSRSFMFCLESCALLLDRLVLFLL